MDLRLSPAALSHALLRPATPARPGSGPAVEPAGGGFTGAMKSVLQEVSAAQNQATRMQREVQLENPTVSLEDTMVAIQKAQIGFQATLHVRNRMVQAYTDIMNMPV